MTLILQTLYIVLAFAAILFLAVVFTKFIGRKTKRTMSGQYINIVESISIGMDKQLHLIRAGDQYILIATAGKTVTFLTSLKLDSTDIEEKAVKTEGLFDFKGFLDKYLQSFRNKKTEKGKENVRFNDELDSFTGGDEFKVNLSKLRSINSRMSKQDDKGRDNSTDDK